MAMMMMMIDDDDDYGDDDDDDKETGYMFSQVLYYSLKKGKYLIIWEHYI